MTISIGDGSMQRNIRDGLCPRCQTQMQPVEVHGHVQCSVCHLVIEECCQGETASCGIDPDDLSNGAGSLS